MANKRHRRPEKRASGHCDHRLIALPAFVEASRHISRARISSIERPRTADEPTASKVESQRAVGRARDADPFAQPDFARRLTIRSEPEHAGVTEVDPVQPAINIQGLA